MTYNKHNTMEVILSIDDYNPGNIELAKIIKSYGLEPKTIFFIDLAEGAKEQIKQLDQMKFQIGGHNLIHDNNLKAKSYEEQKRQIFGCKEEIEKIIGKPCKHYAFNRGRSNEQIRQLVKDAGYTDARGTRVLNAEPPMDKYNMGTTIHCYQRDEYRGVDWVYVAKEMFDYAIDKDMYCSSGISISDQENNLEVDSAGRQYYSMWAHYKELSRPGEMDKFKSILSYIKNEEK